MSKKIEYLTFSDAQRMDYLERGGIIFRRTSGSTMVNYPHAKKAGGMHDYAGDTVREAVDKAMLAAINYMQKPGREEILFLADPTQYWTFQHAESQRIEVRRQKFLDTRAEKT